MAGRSKMRTDSLWKPCLDFEANPPPPSLAKKKRKRKNVQTPLAPRVKSIPVNDVHKSKATHLNWVSPQFDDEMQTQAKAEQVTRPRGGGGGGGKPMTVLQLAHAMSSKTTKSRNENCATDGAVLLQVTGGGAIKSKAPLKGHKNRKPLRTVNLNLSSSSDEEVDDNESFEQQREWLHSLPHRTPLSKETVLDLSAHLDNLTVEGSSNEVSGWKTQLPRHSTLTDSFNPSSSSTPARAYPTPITNTPQTDEKYSDLAHTDAVKDASQEASAVVEDSIIVNSTPSHLYTCGIYCSVRGHCNHT